MKHPPRMTEVFHGEKTRRLLELERCPIPDIKLFLLYYEWLRFPCGVAKAQYPRLGCNQTALLLTKELVVGRSAEG